MLQKLPVSCFECLYINTKNDIGNPTTIKTNGVTMKEIV